MIRAATFSDIPALEKILHNTHARSKYAGRTGINQKALEQLLTGLVAGQKQNGPGATFLMVAENEGRVTGFMAASLGRVFGIGDKLCASDHFLIVEAGNRQATNQLIDAYIEWASSNPKVIEIGLSWSDTVPKGDKAKFFYARKGFKLSGEQYTLCRDMRYLRKAA